MIKHYLKVAFRNLWKYKGQTFISITGLAVGFVCFALATLWIRYEMTFDNFHKNADRMYCLFKPDADMPDGISKVNSSLGSYLKTNFPEINRTGIISGPYLSDIKVGKFEYSLKYIGADASFLDMFNIKCIEGNINVMYHDRNVLAISLQKARQLFGDESPVGKVIIDNWGHEKTICALVSGLPGHSNYSFDLLYLINRGNIIIELSPFTEVEAFKKKLYSHKINIEGQHLEKLSIIPLAEIHYKDHSIERKVQFRHILIFALAGLLVILCSLFNYLTLFISRFRIRQKELALRAVYGASGRSLFALLSVEFAMSLIIALSAGILLIQTVFVPFRTMSGIKLELSSVYLEAFMYIGVSILFSLLVFLLILKIFHRRTLNAAIHGNNKNMFRKISVITQLIISIWFSFCTIVIIKQMYYLHNTDLGFAFKNRASVSVNYGGGVSSDMLDSWLKQIPEITETVKNSDPLIPHYHNNAWYQEITSWDDKPDNIDRLMIEAIDISGRFSEYSQYYEFQLLDGEMLNDEDNKKYVLINESAAKAFGWNKPVGKSFSVPMNELRLKSYSLNNSDLIVKGVVKNIYNFAPTISVKPFFYSQFETYNDRSTVLFKYKEGTWKLCRNKIENFIKTQYPELAGNYKIFNTGEEYDKFLKSENTLLKLLTFVSLVCVIICVFGFVSLVSLTCEERRKEIAIRKINGATIKDILDIFFKEYLVLLIIGATIAFSLGYYVMKRWLEDYVVQTPISAWIYAVILLMLILSIILCVGWKVYRTSRENPVEALKKN
ncbi:MAG: FtsX-like permease family protein [Prevotellaceae bacterium]|jgi:ABC-type lipoprotein release transport system permease subunit|nr:FtsX-like permease family protein [Prevotellaceae bacterium]